MDEMIEMDTIEAATSSGPVATAAVPPPPVQPGNSGAAGGSSSGAHSTIDSVQWPWAADASENCSTWFGDDSCSDIDDGRSLVDTRSSDEVGVARLSTTSKGGPAVPHSANAAAKSQPADRAARKRQRATTPAMHVSALGDVQWREDMPQEGCAGQGVSPEPLDFKVAASLLRDGSVTLRGIRPDFLEGEICAVHGMLYKEDAAVRRKNKTDLYSFKGSYSNASRSASVASTSSGAQLHVQRSYGTVACSRLAAPQAKQRLKVHQLNLILVDQDGGVHDLWPRIYHILENNSTTYRSAAPMHNAVSGILSLTNAAPDSPWVQFFASNRPDKVVGTLTPSNGGVKLTSASGDFAEWHVRKAGEPAFQRGDVVALSDLGLTRKTKDATQLGVVSRQALIEGSVPVSDARKRSGDTVAYTGRVMVRLRGDCRVGDYLIPSGFEDGTAIASRGRPRACVGRALSFSVAKSAQDICLIECGVISPASSVQQRYSQGRSCAIVVAFMLSVSLLSWLSLGSHPSVCASCDVDHDCLQLDVSCLDANVSLPSSAHNCMESGPSVIFPRGRLGSRATFKCPPTHTGRMTGICHSTGWAYTTTCSHKTCPEASLELSGYRLAQQHDIVYAATMVASQAPKHVIVFPPMQEGTGTVTIQCPAGYTGQVSMACMPKSSKWSDPEGQCNWNHCAASQKNVGSELSPYYIQLPAVSHGDTVEISCCSRFSPTGACSGRSDRIGSIFASCSNNSEFTVFGQCVPPDSFELGLTVAARTHMRGAEVLKLHYDNLLGMVGTQIRVATGGAWQMPSSGIFGGLSLRRGDQWASISSRHSYRHASYTFETHSKARPSGRSVAAAGNVACRQLGAASAALVTTCKGLRLLLSHARIADTSKLLEVVCPINGSGKYWAQISSETDSPAIPRYTLNGGARRRGWEWQPATNGDSGRFYGRPPWLPVHESSCTGHETVIAVAHGENVNRSCGWSALNDGVCAPAGNVALCLQHSLSQTAPGSPQVMTSNDANLVVACGNLDTGGTWAVGDDAGVYRHDDLKEPKVFRDTLPHMCRGAKSGNTTCWGRLIELDDTHRYYINDDLIDPAGNAFQISDAEIFGPQGLAHVSPWQLAGNSTILR